MVKGASVNAEELIEVVSKMTKGQWVWGQQYICLKLPAKYVELAAFPKRGCAPEGHQWERDAEGLVALRTWAVPIIQALQAELTQAKADAAIGRLVRLKLTSGNEIPVERCTVLASEVTIATAIRAEQ